MNHPLRLLLASDEDGPELDLPPLLRAIGLSPDILALHVEPVIAPLFYFPATLQWGDPLRREELARENIARDSLKDRLELFSKSGWNVTAEVTAGSPLSEILSHALSFGADLIAARPSHRHAHLGGIAAGLLQCASAPVLLYRSVPPDFQLKTIVVATDFSPFSRGAMDWGLLLSSLSGAALKIIHVLPEASEKWGAELKARVLAMLAEQRERAEREGREYGHAPARIESVAVTAETPVRGILSEPADLRIIATAGQTGLAHVLGSVTRRLARETDQPLLALPTTDRTSPREIWRRTIAQSTRA